jgi:bifunctional polynucleotide phosphatase/kinase
VASFFTPVSQKPPERTLWQERGPGEDSPNTLLVGRYEPEYSEAYKSSGETAQQRCKIAAFDFVSHEKTQFFFLLINLFQ